MTAPASALHAAAIPPRMKGPPLVGHALAFLRDPLGLIERGAAEHGKVFSFRLGHRDAVCLLGPEASRFFFEETDQLLSMREAYPFFKSMFSDDIYFMAEPEDYKAQKSIVLPRFAGKQMEGYVGVMARETVALMDALGDEGQMDLTERLGPLVMHIAAHAFFGEEFRRRLGDEIFRLFRDFSGGIEFVFPGWLPVPRLLKSKRAKKRMYALFTQAVAERRQRPVDPPDFLQTFVAARDKHGRPLEYDLIVNLMMALVWAGHETTVGHLAWGLLDLVQNPLWMRQVLAEQDQVLAGVEPFALTMEHCKLLRRMEWSLKESERLHPVAFMVMRMAREDFVVSGHRIAKGTLVFASPWVSHRLPDVFTRPETFDPERFSPERDEGRRPYSLIGFGGGPHRCAGVSFAYLEMKVVLTLLLQRYELELVTRDVRPSDGKNTKWPRSPCIVRYRRRALAGNAPRSTARTATRVDTAGGPELQARAAGRCPFHALLGRA